MTADANLSQLPDAGLFLPDGRQVELSLRMSWSTLAEGTDIARLKAAVRDRFVENSFKEFVRTDGCYGGSRLITVPDFTGQPDLAAQPQD